MPLILPMLFSTTTSTCNVSPKEMSFLRNNLAYECSQGRNWGWRSGGGRAICVASLGDRIQGVADCIF